MTVQNSMYLHQIDVTTTYLNSNLQDEIYMQQPQCFMEGDSSEKFFRLHKAIYGLKQRGKEWNSKLEGILRKIGFSPCENEPCLYKTTSNGKLVLIAVYVDDLIIGCNDLAIVCAVKGQIVYNFDIVDKGELNHFLGMEIECESSTGAIRLSQTQYIRNILEQYGTEAE